MAALVLTMLLAACTQAGSTPIPSPALSSSKARLPSVTDDSANFAADPGVTTILIGRVIEKAVEETLPLAGSEDSIRFGSWRVDVERYLVDPQPYGEVVVRIEETVVRPDGSLMAPRFPVGLGPGDRAVFLLTKDAGPNRPPLPRGAFALAILGPGALGRWTVRDGQVNTMLGGQGRRELLEEFVTRIVRVAEDAGRTSGDLTLTPTPTPTPVPLPPSQGVHTPEDYRKQYEGWPEEYKFAIDDGVSVRFAYPSPIIDFAGFAFISHISSASTVVLRRPYTFLDAQGNVSSEETGENLWGEEIMVFRHYESGEGEVRLESVLGDREMMRRILSGPGE